MPKTVGVFPLGLLAALLGLTPAAKSADNVGPSAFLRLLDIPDTDTVDSFPLPADSYRVADGISAPVVIGRTEPEYPAGVLPAALEGTVMAAAIIGEDGSAHSFQVTHGLGFGFDEKAVEAVSKWRFRPGEYAGHPVATFAAFAVDFRIPHNPSRWHLIGVRLKTDEHVSPPALKAAIFPHGAGISNDSPDEGQLVVAAGRLAIVTLSFEVDKTGKPTSFEVEKASQPLWGDEAIAVMRSWRFQPAMLDGKPVTASVQVDLAWGPRELPLREEPAKSRGTTGIPLDHPPIVARVEPLYSMEALAQSIGGRVVVSMTVDEQGSPRDLQVQQSPGYGLDQKAIEAVSQWRFRPMVSRGQAIAVPATVEVNFKIPQAYGNVAKPKVFKLNRPLWN